MDSLQGARDFELELRERTLKFGTAARPTDLSFGEWADIWMREKVAPSAKRSGLRTKRYILSAHLLPRFGKRRLRDIDAAAIDRFMADLRANDLSKKTVNNIVSVLHTALYQAKRRKLLFEVPSIEFLSAGQPAFRFLEAEEAERLVTAAPKGLWRTMILCALHTGLRANELLALEWPHVDLRRRQATILQGEVDGYTDTTKTEKIRYVPLSDDLLCELETLPRTGARVFPMPPVKFPYHHALDRLHAISKVARIEPSITWHPLRHTFATLALAGGAPITIVRDILGHTTIGMTNRYAHAARNMLHLATDALPRLTNTFRHLSGTTVVAPGPIQADAVLATLESWLKQAKTANGVAVDAWSG